MSQFQIEPDTVAPLPGLLRSSLAEMAVASTLSCPDTGTSTATTRAAMDTVGSLVTYAGRDADELAHRVAAALAAYRRTDGDVNWALDTTLAGGLG